MKHESNKKRRLVAWIFFLALALVGLVTGTFLWALTKDHTFFSCFALSYPFSIFIYLVWIYSEKMLTSETKTKALGLLGILGRFILAVVQIAVCFILIHFTTKNYLYILIPPTLDLFVTLFVIGNALLLNSSQKKEG